MGWDEFKAEIRERVDIVDLISRDVAGLEQSGTAWRGAKGWPSLIVWRDTGSWRDFGGGDAIDGGDAFDWIMRQLSCGFMDAARELATLAGVDMPGGDGEDPAVEANRREIMRALTWAAMRMHENLPRWARSHLEEHYGLRADILSDLAIGYCDGHLHEEMMDAGFDQEVVLGTGLFIPKKRGGAFDFFEHRIVFPYWRNGRVVYAIGRRTEMTGDKPHQMAKYKKLPTRSPKFRWVSEHIANDVFYNEDVTRRRVSRLLITEGVTDCISAMQAGIPCISPVTVRFRNQDIPKLRMLTERAGYSVICNDADDGPDGAPGPGLQGAISTARALWPDRDVRIARLPAASNDKMDVNLFLREHGRDELDRILSAARRLPEWSIDRLPRDLIQRGRAADLDDALRLAIGLIPLEQSALIRRAADRVQASVRDVRQRLQEILDQAKAQASPREARPRMQGEVFAGPDHYFSIGRDGSPSIISSFRITISHRVLLDGVEMLAGSVRCQGGRNIDGVTFPPHCFTSRQRFVSFLSRVAPDAQWTGSDNQVQGLLGMLAGETAPLRRGTDTIGWLDTEVGPRWVTPDVVLGPSGAVRDPDVAYVAEGNPLDDRAGYLAANPADVAAAAAVALPAMVRINEPHVILPIVGWFFAAPMREPIQRELGHFPMLVVWGSRGCGKTSTLREMCRAMGVRDPVAPFSATETEFSMMRTMSGTNGMPIWMDEYKPSDMHGREARLHRFLRRLYDGERESRGRPDLTIKSYRLRAPVALSGESRPEEAALVERSIVSSPRAGFLEGESGTAARQAFVDLRSSRPGLLARPYIEMCLRTDVPRLLRGTRELASSMLAANGGTRLSPRVADNVAAMMLGLLQWERFAKEMGVEVPEIGPWLPGMTAKMLDEMAPGGATADELDQLIAELSSLALAGHLEHGKHYRWIRGELCIHLPTCLRIYQERQRAAGQRDETNGLRALRRLANEKAEADDGYIVAASRRVEINSAQARCLALDPSRAPEHVDLDGFGAEPGLLPDFNKYMT